MLAWLWEPRLRGRGANRLAIAVVVVVAATLISLRNDFYLIAERSADPRERMVYNHTTPWIDQLSRNRLALWREATPAIPLAERKVLLAGAPSWPGLWYFRRCGYELLPAGQKIEHVDPKVDLILAEPDQIQPILDADPAAWIVSSGMLRMHWWAPWPDEPLWNPRHRKQREEARSLGKIGLLSSSLTRLWRYYWLRETWTDPGGFPIVALERRSAN